MKAIITQYKKMAFAIVVAGGMIVPCAMVAKNVPAQSKKRNQAVADADAAKCKPCQGKPTRDEVSANIDADPSKCKPCQQAKSIKDEMAAAIAQGRSVVHFELDPASDMVQACCEFCAMPDSLGCQGDNRARCSVCQQGLLKMSIAEAAAAALALAAQLAKEAELDTTLVDASRAPREELVDPCGPCGPVDCEAIDSCRINQKLCALQKCCCMVNNRLQCQGEFAHKFFKRTKHRLEDIEEVLGQPGASVIDIPTCEQGLSIVDFIDNTEVDMMTWLKSMYVLLYQVYLCSCLPCDLQ